MRRRAPRLQSQWVSTERRARLFPPAALVLGLGMLALWLHSSGTSSLDLRSSMQTAPSSFDTPLRAPSRQQVAEMNPRPQPQQQQSQPQQAKPEQQPAAEPAGGGAAAGAAAAAATAPKRDAKPAGGAGGAAAASKEQR